MNDGDSEQLIVSAEEEDIRLDKYLVQCFPSQSRTYFQYLIEQGLVLVNGTPVKKRTLLQQGDEVEVEFALTPETTLTPENIPLTIIYEDEDILAINKPVGMVVHPGAGNWSGTFANALLYYCQKESINHSLRPGIVHRLDKDTSGVLLAAKNEMTQQALVELFASRQVSKKYLAICIGNPGKRRIQGNIGRHPVHRKKMTILETQGKNALTDCETVLFNGTLSYVKLSPLTGRTHQLRVHLQSIATPILGDPIYGTESLNKKYHIFRQLLHAYEVQFRHPRTQQIVHITAEIPADFQAFIKKIEATAPK